MEKKQSGNLVFIILGIVLSYLTYCYVLGSLQDGLSDFHGHTYIYLPMFTKEDWVIGWRTVPYCLWHLVALFVARVVKAPIEVAAATSTIVFTLFFYGVLCWMILRVCRRIGAREDMGRAGLISFALCVAEPLYLFWLNPDSRFNGVYSMNPFHNPTQITVRGFSVIVFCLMADMLEYMVNPNYKGIFFHVERGLKKYYFLLTGMLFLSAMSKPTFAEMFIPAVGIMMLVTWIVKLIKKDNAKEYLGRLGLTFLCAVPSLIYIVLQFFGYFIWGRAFGDGGSVILTKPFETWHIYTDNVVIAIVLGMAFPLFMILIDAGYYFKTVMGRLGLLGYVVGVAEASLLGQSGVKFSDGNFIWPMMSGMLVLWITAVVRLLTIEQKQQDTKLKSVLINIAWAILLVQAFFGIMLLILK